MPEEEKLFYTIGEAAEILSVKPYVLRYWESEFKMLDPKKSETGQRTYRKKDLQIAQTIKRLLYEEKYTIAGAIPKLEELEKAGFDPLDMAKVKTVAQSNRPASASDEDDEPGPSPAPVAPAAPAKPAIPQEKVEEFKKLIAASQTILKKYQLN